MHRIGPAEEGTANQNTALDIIKLTPQGHKTHVAAAHLLPRKTDPGEEERCIDAISKAALG